MPAVSIDTLRYWIALLVLVCLPPGLMLWFFIHPFARFWRRLGAGWTYALLSVPSLLVMAFMWSTRDRLLAVDFGFSLPLTGLAIVALGAGLTMTLKLRRLLTARIMTGVAELGRDPGQWQLLSEGIYAKIRHPRYVALLFVQLAYALFANYLATYVACLLYIPVILGVVALEERELRRRFGERYDQYCRRVPRFIPHLR
jgi:protein-S-isoprenylcysteine O-methyltransferase Ste14